MKDTFSHLVNPKIPVSETVVKLTGISNEMAGLARDIDEVMQEFLAFAGEFTWVGHNVIYDYGFVKQWAVNHNIPLEKRAVDTLKIARKCLVFPEKKSLDSLCMFYHIEREERHRAYMDALAAHRLYEILKKEFYEGEKELFLPRELQYHGHRFCLLPHQRLDGFSAPASLISPALAYSHIFLLFHELTRSEASRLADKIIRQHGKIPDALRHRNGNFHP